MMKRFLGAVAFTFALVLFAAPAEAQMPAGEEVTITGTVIDISCKFGLGQTGEAHRMCAQVCADKGIPLGIVTADGTLYIPTTAGMPGDNQNPRLRAFAEQKVTVTGKAFSAGGAKVIQISEIKGA